MSYIIVWNPNSRDSHIHVDTHGFIQSFEEREDAIKEAEECKDNEHYRNFCLYQEGYLKTDRG